VENQYVVGEKHLKLKLRKFYYDDEQKLGHLYESMLFFHEDSLPETIDAVYRLNINKYGGNDSLQLILEHWVSV
jgi:single-stranded-DNA-specific exonuclease